MRSAQANQDGSVVGRESELVALREFMADCQPARGLVLTGGPGIGKTTLWETGISIAAEGATRVLSARASSAEAQLSFAALIDLCDGVRTPSLAALPEAQRAALEVALLRATPTGPPPEPQAIAQAFLNVIRALSADAPVLLAVDDIQWLDSPSAEVLGFVARRVGDAPVAFLLSRRGDQPSAIEATFERGQMQCLAVGPLSFGATRSVLAERLGLNMSRQLLRRVVDITIGNPLFVLELGRVLLERGLPEISDDIPVPGGIEEMLGTRVASLAAPQRRLLVAVALSAEVHTRELAALAGSGALEDAIDSGLVVVHADRVRAFHPLLAAAAKHASSPGEQRELHLALAGTASDAVLRAKHLALASKGDDAALADQVAAAAGDAAARGGAQQAVELAEHALRLTPADSHLRSERLLALAAYLETAGELQRLTDLLTPALSSLPAGAPRARAWLMLSEGVGPTTMDDLARYRDHALAECDDDPALRATVLAKKAANAAGSTVSRLTEAASWAREAVSVARGTRPDAERLAFYGLAWVRAITGRPVDEQCRCYREVSDTPSYLAGSPERIAGQRLIWRGELAAARSTLSALMAAADERGERESYALARLHMCELHLRGGEWEAAAALLDEWAQSSDRELMFRPKYERCRALLEAGRGAPGEAERWAQQAVVRAEESGCRWDGLEALRALALAAVLQHDPVRAVAHLREVWVHTQTEGVSEPGVFPVAAELVEALAESGELDEARAVTRRLRELAQAQEHPWGLVSAGRCEALLLLVGERYDADAADALERAADAYEQLDLRFDAARSLLALGRAQRRFKQWGLARASLERAAEILTATGAPGWAEQARSELARAGARRSGRAGELTATELRAAELAASGLSNKEIARELFVTVHTVEVHLSRAYAKLGISSRRQLAQRLTA